VVETGNWLLSRKVLISPIALGTPDWRQRELPVAITMQQVKDSPDFDTEKPVSRQYEIEYLGHYGYPSYWAGMGLWGDAPYPSMLMPQLDAGIAASLVQSPEKLATEQVNRQSGDPSLRSCSEVTHYVVHAIDGDVGHISGMLVDEQSWAIRYLIVDTGGWWLGHQVLVTPQWIDEISWVEATVSIKLTRQAVQDAPRYDWTVGVTREQEARIHEHYGFAGYWDGEEKKDAEPSTA
jgi:hypothetical protein